MELITKQSIYTKLALLFVILGGLFSAYLWYGFQGSQGVVCPISDCAEVLTSPTSLILGVHMSVYGFFFFGLAFIFIVQKILTENKVIDYMLVGLASFGLAFTLMLRLVELFVTHSWCIWCWMVFGATIGLFITTLLETKRIQGK
jgi:uncharacterized membrane protein